MQQNDSWVTSLQKPRPAENKYLVLPAGRGLWSDAADGGRSCGVIHVEMVVVLTVNSIDIMLVESTKIGVGMRSLCENYPYDVQTIWSGLRTWPLRYSLRALATL